MIDGEDICPLLKDKCIKHRCKWYTQLLGTNPQTGQPVNEFNCAVAVLPLLLCEGAKETRQAAAAVESFRNETVKIQNNFLELAYGRRQKAIGQ